MALKKIPKPKNTRIIVNKSVEQLEIHNHPAKNPFIIMIGDGIFIILILTLSCFAMIIPILAFGWLILLLIFSAILLLVLRISGYYVFRRSQIKFDRNRFEIKEQLGNFTCNRFRGAVSDIVGIFAVKGYGGLEIRLARGYPFVNSSHSFGRGMDGLSAHESAWLAQEIHDWLNLR